MYIKSIRIVALYFEYRFSFRVIRIRRRSRVVFKRLINVVVCGNKRVWLEIVGKYFNVCFCELK